ncbi:hypothetical protein [Methylobacter sp.]|uniref:hypothetical protein n=1 Tax=Methylobacter sp. TaxID=2051955 RepID=UPI003DA3DC6B
MVQFGSIRFANEKPRPKLLIKNKYNYDKEVFNGDIGSILSLDLEESRLSIRFDDQDVDYEFSELDEISLAYATSIHKSQGAEYPVAVMPSDAALHPAGAEPGLHGCDARQAVGRNHRRAESAKDGGQDTEIATAADKFGKAVEGRRFTLMPEAGRDLGEGQWWRNFGCCFVRSQPEVVYSITTNQGFSFQMVNKVKQLLFNNSVCCLSIHPRDPD